MGDMLGCVGTHHVTFACTGATEPILTSADLARVIKKPTMLVDISVPRNVDDEGANAIEGCKAYNVDDLKAVVQANQARRKKLMVEAEEVLKEELQSFESWQQSLGSVPMISMLQMRAERIRSEEFRKVESKLQVLRRPLLSSSFRENVKPSNTGPVGCFQVFCASLKISNLDPKVEHSKFMWV